MSRKRKQLDKVFRLSNGEVLEFFQAQKTKGSGKHQKRFQHRDWIEKQVVEYLEASPCSQLLPSRRQEFKCALQNNKRKQSDHGKLGEEDNVFALSDIDIAHILDFMPTEQVDLHLLVSDFHKMTSRRQEALIELIDSFKTTNASEACEEATPTKEPDHAVKTEITI